MDTNLREVSSFTIPFPSIIDTGSSKESQLTAHTRPVPPDPVAGAAALLGAGVAAGVLAAAEAQPEERHHQCQDGVFGLQ